MTAMENYTLLYSISVRHDYFGEKPCRALQLGIPPASAELMRRRGMIFRETAAGTWSLFHAEEPDTDNDMLLMELFISDPSFVLYTDWPGFRPADSYDLQLPAQEEELDAARAIRHTDRKRGFNSGFCTIRLRLTDGMTQAARAGHPLQTVLEFHAPEKEWEYLFIQQGDCPIEGDSLLLEDTAGETAFKSFGQCEAYGRKAWRTVSENRIPMRAAYNCRLKLSIADGSRQKRVLLSHIAPPEPGRYPCKASGTIRQVCYF